MSGESRQVLPPAIDAGLRAHHAALDAFLRHATALSALQWEAPRASGKWTPAQETAHLALAYGTFAAALRGGPPRELRVPVARALELQRTVLPGILEGKGFPTGAKAPAETEPPERPGGQGALLPQLCGAAQAFEEALVGAWAAAPDSRVVHPYFGALRLPELLGLLTAHLHHHARNLPPLSGAPVG
jgi:DinB family protein